MSITCVQFSTIVLHIALALQSVTLSTHRSLGLHVKKVLVTQAHEFQYYLVGKLHLAHCKQHVHISLLNTVTACTLTVYT